MIAKIVEFGGCFDVALEPENQEEAVKLIRMALNAKKEMRGIYIYARKGEKVFDGSIVIGKKKKNISRLES